MILKKFKKQPLERKDYTIDYLEFLSPASDSLVALETEVYILEDATPTDDPATGSTALEVDEATFDATRATLWIAGGINGADYKVTVRVTTDGGRIDESELIFRVRDV